MKKLVIMAMVLAGLQTAHALDPRVTNFLIQVCKDHQGRPVDFVFHEDIQSYAYASVHQETRRGGRYIPIIHVNTRFFRWISIPSQAFVLAHECGHHALGHVAMGGGSTPKIEFEADCWATKLLVDHRIIRSKKELEDIERDFFRMGNGKPNPRGTTHPGTIERFDNIHACYDAYVK